MAARNGICLELSVRHEGPSDGKDPIIRLSMLALGIWGAIKLASVLMPRLGELQQRSGREQSG